MNYNEVKYIPENAACPMASCTRSNTCARYANYQKALAEEETFCVMNPQLMKVGNDTCPYHLVAEKQRWAFGFQNIYNTIPSGQTHYLWSATPYSERRYYKAKKGEIPIEPEMQRTLLAIFERKGGDISIGFDRYEERVALVKK